MDMCCAASLVLLGALGCCQEGGDQTMALPGLRVLGVADLCGPLIQSVLGCWVVKSWTPRKAQTGLAVWGTVSGWCSLWAAGEVCEALHPWFCKCFMLPAPGVVCVPGVTPAGAVRCAQPHRPIPGYCPGQGALCGCCFVAAVQHMSLRATHSHMAHTHFPGVCALWADACPSMSCSLPSCMVALANPWLRSELGVRSGR
jgi:hypothetical protein